jgi:hypothetical protein
LEAWTNEFVPLKEIPMPFKAKVDMSCFRSPYFFELFEDILRSGGGMVRSPLEVMQDGVHCPPCKTMAKLAEQFGSTRGTPMQWRWLLVQCSRLIVCWQDDWVLNNFRMVESFESIFHVDFLAVAGTFLIGFVVYASAPYELYFLKNPLFGEKEERENEQDTIKISLEKDDAYCLHGPVLRLPHCPVSTTGKGERTVYLLGGHSTTDLSSGRTKKINDSLLFVNRYYHYKKGRNSQIVHHKPKNTEGLN